LGNKPGHQGVPRFYPGTRRRPRGGWRDDHWFSILALRQRNVFQEGLKDRELVERLAGWCSVSRTIGPGLGQRPHHSEARGPKKKNRVVLVRGAQRNRPDGSAFNRCWLSKPSGDHRPVVEVAATEGVPKGPEKERKNGIWHRAPGPTCRGAAGRISSASRARFLRAPTKAGLGLCFPAAGGQNGR